MTLTIPELMTRFDPSNYSIKMQFLQHPTHEMYRRSPMQGMPINWTHLHLPVGFRGEDHNLSSNVSRLTGK